MALSSLPFKHPALRQWLAPFARMRKPAILRTCRLQKTKYGTMFERGDGVKMSKPKIFTVSALWDDEASVWSGHCDDIPAAADAPTLDALLEKISAMAIDLLPDNHPEIDPADVFVQITALKEAEPA